MWKITLNLNFTFITTTSWLYKLEVQVVFHKLIYLEAIVFVRSIFELVPQTICNAVFDITAWY